MKVNYVPPYVQRECHKRPGNSNNMRPMTIPSAPENAVAVCAFDLSIQDLEQRRRERIKFDSMNDMTQYFGIASRKRAETMIKNKTPVEKDGKKFAIRRESVQFDKPLGSSK